ncbi:MAG TPA: electron transport complex subunit RsxC [Candidatus Acidoferrum sp.]|nr:electron transport complex subunit RsxC [Candidatus Acidoferrum sp.]
MSASPRLWNFPGGIAPLAHKAESLRGPIRRTTLPPQLIVPLTQPGHVAPNVLVQTGERVRKGQILACGDDATGVTVHAPAAGVINAIGEQSVANMSALPELCVIIDTDAAETTWDKLPPLDYRTADADTLIARIADCGISGLGGAGFPTHAKLRAALRKIDIVIVNAAECEPWITADEALLRERAADVVAGSKILLQLTGALRCLIGIEDSKPQAVAALQAAVDDPRLKVVVFPARYPSGAEAQLIYTLTGKEMPSGTRPVHNGILCHNVGTVYAIARAVLHGEALLSRIVTITGGAVSDAANYEASIGTPISFLLQQSGFDERSLSQLVCGGSLMGIALPHAQLPVAKTTNCVIAATRSELPPPQPEQACIRCGDCADVCPVQLVPQQLYWFARSQQFDQARANHLNDCIECGACAWVCPSHIPLVQYYRAAKAELAEQDTKQQHAVHWRQRFEAHQHRMALEQAQAEQRRAERAALAAQKQEQAVKAGPSPQDIVAAALARVQAKKAAQAAAKPSSDDDNGASS